MSEHIQYTASAAPRFQLFYGWRWSDRRLPRLDLKSLPEHLKRDLGFSDGRASPLRDILRD